MKNQDHPSRVTRLNFFERGAAYIASQKSMAGKAPCVAIGLESPEWSVWMRYFDDHLHWRPMVIRMVIAGQLPSMTVPAQWPQWFDNDFAQRSSPSQAA